jgi:hypothetical protein
MAKRKKEKRGEEEQAIGNVQYAMCNSPFRAVEFGTVTQVEFRRKNQIDDFLQIH